MSMKSGQGELVNMNLNSEAQDAGIGQCLGIADFHFFEILPFPLHYASGVEPRHCIALWVGVTCKDRSMAMPVFCGIDAAACSE